MVSKIILKNDRIRSIENRHPWIFSGAIKKEDRSIPPGSVVDLFSENQQFLARGFYNPNSDIRLRILTYDPQTEIGPSFFLTKIKTALNLRQRYLNFSNTNMFRLIFGEGDELSGLIIDIYDKTAVISTYSIGFYAHLTIIIDSLKQVLPKLETIYLKNDSRTLAKEGVPQEQQLLWGKPISDRIVTRENGVQFYVDIPGGQKTGMFIDQRDNRALLGTLAAGKNVLNCFSYSGGFSLYAALNGATTTSVDISSKAIELAKDNFRLNNLPLNKHQFLAEDVFSTLNSVNKNEYDVIVLDPPAFAKSPKQVKKAKGGYREINRSAMKAIRENGLLLTCSCSHYIYRDMFQKIIYTAALDSNTIPRILSYTGHPVDHPVNIFHPESEYLKAMFLSIQSR